MIMIAAHVLGGADGGTDGGGSCNGYRLTIEGALTASWGRKLVKKLTIEVGELGAFVQCLEIVDGLKSDGGLGSIL